MGKILNLDLNQRKLEKLFLRRWALCEEGRRGPPILPHCGWEEETTAIGTDSGAFRNEIAILLQPLVNFLGLQSALLTGILWTRFSLGGILRPTLSLEQCLEMEAACQDIVLLLPFL